MREAALPAVEPVALRDPDAPFACVPPRDGYAWWYVDAFSDDHRHALTLIAFVGSVFSPYYALARARGAGEPANHCALNVALYGPAARWAMTERGAGALRQDPRSLHIGPSRLDWDGRTLTVDFDELAVPVPRRLRGRVRLQPLGVDRAVYALDAHARHRWGPLAARARVEVVLEQPKLRWQGHAYFDSNDGDAPLEQDFAGWHWSRCALADGRTALFYDVRPRRGPPRSLALGTAADGLGAIAPLGCRRLPTTRWWRIGREACADPERPLTVGATLEDTPFYARSLLHGSVHGQPATIVHESLSLDRFSRPWVRALLPFRMPRRR
jgi:carotenoid 1,2-hydratase